MRKAISILVLSLLALVHATGCTVDPVTPDGQSTVLETTVRPGDSLAYNGYTVVFPAGSIDGPATVRLGPVSGRPERGLKYHAVMPPPVSIEIYGASLVGTIHVIVPTVGIDADRSVIALEEDGAWTPLQRTAVDAGHNRVDLSPTDARRANLFQVDYGTVTTNLRRLSGERPGNVVLLVHGLGNSPGVWSTALIDSLHADVGEVWALEYDWKRGILDVAAEASARMEGEFMGRPLLILAHSTGGLLARAIVRTAVDLDLNVHKVMFLGTPHFGLSAETVERSAYDVFSEDVVLDPYAWDGVRDVEKNSATIAHLSQPLILDHPPEYLCVVGYRLEQLAGECDQSDGVVCRESADLFGADADGLHESARVAHTRFVAENGSHATLIAYALRRWPSTRAFLGADPVTYELYVSARPDWDPSAYGKILVYRDRVLRRDWIHRLPGEGPLVVVDETVRTSSSTVMAEVTGGSYYTLLGDTISYTFPPSLDVYDATTDGRYIYAWMLTTRGLLRYDLLWSNPDTLFTLSRDLGSRYMGITYDPDTRSVWLSPWDRGGALANYSLDGELLKLVPAEGITGTALAMDYADRTLWLFDFSAGEYVQLSRQGEVLGTWTDPDLVNVFSAEFYPALE